MLKRILIVEDDGAIAEMVQLMLQGEGYDVDMQTDVQMALNMQEPLPDLLLLDIRLSGADGAAICRQLKSQERTRHLPIILISAMPQTVGITRETGAEAFLAKPFAMQEFLTLVAHYMK
jgi:two-component system, OmpR family, response regulator VicR